MYRGNCEVDGCLADCVFSLGRDSVELTVAQADGQCATFGIGKGHKWTSKVLRSDSTGLAVKPLVLGERDQCRHGLIWW